MVAYLDLSAWNSFTYSGLQRRGGKCQDTKPLKNLIRAVEGMVRRHFPQALYVQEKVKNVLTSISITAHKQNSRFSPSKRLQPSGAAVRNLSPNLLNSPTVTETEDMFQSSEIVSTSPQCHHGDTLDAKVERLCKAVEGLQLAFNQHNSTVLGIKKDVIGIKRGVGMIRCIQSGSKSRRVDERRLGDGDLNELEDLDNAIAKSEEFKLLFTNSKKLFLSGNSTYSDMLTLIVIQDSYAGFDLDDGLPGCQKKLVFQKAVSSSIPGTI